MILEENNGSMSLAETRRLDLLIHPYIERHLHASWERELHFQLHELHELNEMDKQNEAS